MNVFWIPIVAIVFGIGIAMLGVWTDHIRRSQILEHQHRERMAAIEKGITLPPTRAEVTERLKKLPCVFGDVRLYSNLETLESARALHTFRFEALEYRPTA